MKKMTLASARTALVAALLVGSPLRAHGETASSSVPDLYASSYSLEANSDNTGALRKMRAVLGQDPNDYVAQLRVGWLLYLNKQYPESAAAYRKAVKRAPRAVEPKLGLLLPLIAMRRHKEALSVADRVLKVDGGNFTARSRKAFLLYNLGRYGKAAVEYRSLLEHYPSNVDMMSGLGWSQLKQGNRREARRTFEKLLRVAPTNSLAKTGMSQCSSGG